MSKQYNEERIRLFAQLSRTLGEQPALDALRRVPRERFLPELLRPLAYCNIPLSIGYGQTISQPYMVAKATAALELQGDEDVLEVGAGCGYQAAALAEMLPFGRVFATERIPELRALAARNLETCGFDNVTVRGAGATLGAPEDGPFDAILVSAAAPGVPHALVGQLKSGGRMVVPVGGRSHQNADFGAADPARAGVGKPGGLPVCAAAGRRGLARLTQRNTAGPAGNPDAGGPDVA